MQDKKAQGVMSTKIASSIIPNKSEHLYTKEPNLNPTSILKDSPNQRNIDKITNEILNYKGQIIRSFYEIGKLLIEAKTQLIDEHGHGRWLKWLSESIDISERMAQRYMQLAEGFPNPTLMSDLNMTKALALLALPEAEREMFIINTHEIKGKDKKVTEMSTKEVKKTICKITNENFKSGENLPRQLDSEVSENVNVEINIDKDTEANVDANTLSNSNNNNNKNINVEDFADNLELAKVCLSSNMRMLINNKENLILFREFSNELISITEITSSCMSMLKQE